MYVMKNCGSEMEESYITALFSITLAGSNYNSRKMYIFVKIFFKWTNRNQSVNIGFSFLFLQ